MVSKAVTINWKRFIIGDDDQQIRRLLRRMLEQADYTAIEAANGKEAIKQFDLHQPDVVITDIFMPEKEGIETIIELKQNDPHVKIIAISGGGKISPTNYLHLAEKIGAITTLEKPIGRDQLLSAVNRALSNR